MKERPMGKDEAIALAVIAVMLLIACLVMIALAWLVPI